MPIQGGPAVLPDLPKRLYLGTPLGHEARALGIPAYLAALITSSKTESTIFGIAYFVIRRLYF